MNKNLSILSSSHFITSKLKSILVGTALVSSLSFAHAQTSVLVPDPSLATGSFTGPLSSATRIYQMIIDDSVLTSLNGKYLSSISFRLSNSATTAWPDADSTYSSYEIYLSDGVEPANRQSQFVNNIVGSQTLVRSGQLVIPAGSLTTASSADPFSFQINFDTPYLYTGTNLVIEIHHGTSNKSTANAAIGTSGTGYGSLFTACWATTYGANVSNGNFSAIKINSVDHLGVKSVEFDAQNVLYPNPVNDVLTIKSTKIIKEITVLNMVGQKVFSEQKNDKKVTIPVLNLPKGVYILQTIDEQGNTKNSKFIKE